MLDFLNYSEYENLIFLLFLFLLLLYPKLFDSYFILRKSQNQLISLRFSKILRLKILIFLINFVNNYFNDFNTFI